MLKKRLIAGLLLSVIAVAALVDSADARRGRGGSGRKCPRGQEDIGGQCVPDPTPGNNIPVAPTIL